MYLGPNNAGLFGQNGVFADQPNLDQLENFCNNFLYKIQIERGSVFENNCQLMYLRPHNKGHFEQMGVSANRPQKNNFDFFQLFLRKIKVQREYISWKKFNLVYLGPHTAGHFRQMHSCQLDKYGLIKIILCLLHAKSCCKPKLVLSVSAPHSANGHQLNFFYNFFNFLIAVSNP